MALEDHIGPDGIVTEEALAAAARDELPGLVSYRNQLRDAGWPNAAALLDGAIDDELDAINQARPSDPAPRL